MAGSTRSDAANRRGQESNLRSKLFACIAALGLLLLLVVLGVAPASADESGAPAPGLPTPEQVVQAIEAEGAGSTQPPLTDPEAAESLPHKDLGRDEALELLQGVFEQELQAPAGIFDELEVEKFLSPNVAVIPGDGPPVVATEAEESEIPPSVAEEAPEAPQPMTEKERLLAGFPPGGEREAPAPTVEGPGQLEGATLLESSIPLRAEAPSGQAEPVDLSLEHSEGSLQPAAPLVDVDIPHELGDGIKFPELGVTIELAGAPEERTPSTVDQSVGFFPNVATDSDLGVALTPTGVETLTQLRSADSPHTQTFNLELPPGATLKASEDGGATIVRGEETLLGVAAPTAIDANGAKVPVSLDVSGDSLTLTVSPGESAKTPILLDPLFQSYEWANSVNGGNGICSSSFEFHSENTCTNREEWSSEELSATVPPTITARSVFQDWSKYVPHNTPGLYIASVSAADSNNDRGSWNYTVPRYFTDPEKYKDEHGVGERPTSFISHMTLWNLLWNANSSHLSPYLFAGIWDPQYGKGVSSYAHEGLWGHSLEDMNYRYEFNNSGSNADTHAAIGYVSVQATETQSGQNAEAYVGSASIELADKDVPTFVAPSGPSGWVNQTPLPIPFTAADSGLGVQSLTTTDLAASGHTWKTSYGCIGVGDAACPRVWKSTEAGHPALQYDPSVMAQGIDHLGVVAEDPVGNKSASTGVEVMVDHTAPALAFSGTMTEQATLGTKRPNYALMVNATDGTPAQPQSGVAKVSIEFDGKPVTETKPGCATENCAIPIELGIESGKFAAGQHTVKVTATDAVGISTTKTLTIELHPSPPSLTLSGPMTEQGALGTTRPRYNLKLNAAAEAGIEGPAPAPTFSSSFGGGLPLSHPADAAVDSKGNIWVADKANNRIAEFDPNGNNLYKSSGVVGTKDGQLNQPSALALDAKGNIWVVDHGNNRVQEFNSKGEFLFKFGTYGSTKGLLNGPEGIAIDAKGNIWVSDSTRVQRFNEKGEALEVIASKGSGTGQIGEPGALDAGPGGTIWITDWGNNRVSVFTESGQFVRQFGSEGTGNGQFKHPDGIAVDSKGDVWVGDEGNNRVEEFNQSGEYVAQFGAKGSGNGQFSFGFPMGIAADSKGSIWVADTGNNRIQKWLIPGYVPSYSGTAGTSGTGNGQYSHPADVAVDSEGNRWAQDTGNNRVQKFNANNQYVSQFGSAGSGNGQFKEPAGTATDAEGNLWVLDTGNNRVEKFNAKGEYLSQFGSAGSGNGQFKEPTGIAIDQNSGVIFIADRGNNRIERFTATGAYFGTIGVYGSENSQFKEPTGIAIGGPSGSSAYTFFVTDAGNNRVQRFTPMGAFISKFGSAGSGDGQLSHPGAIDVDTAGDVWVADQNNGRILEFSQGGEYLTQFGSAGSGTGQFGTAWPIGINADPKGNIWIADGANNRVQLWHQSSWRSQITTEITVDGKRVNAGEAGCISEHCSLAREWALEASSYSPGKHTVLAKATDGLGNTTTKTLTVEVQPDTTKPVLQASGALVEAPEGWVEQESYGLSASATDAGYGLSSIAFRIDGQQVASTSKTCPEGGCEASLSKAVDMSPYSGGAHAAELVATDGAGNAATKKWTINVDPKGHISATEAEETLEAVEETSEATLVAPTEEVISAEERADGNNPSLIEGENELQTIGVPDPSTIPTNPMEGFTVKLPEGSISATPVGVGEGATPMIDAEEAAAVGGNTTPEVDSAIRPVFDGLLTFGDIRDASAPETYSWKVNLGPQQVLKSVDSQHAEVDYKDGFEAYLITAEPASDAVGTAVPTSLSVSEGDVITQRVEHREKTYVYPVVAGVGWEGGFHTETIVGPKDQQELKEEEERLLREEHERVEAGGEQLDESWDLATQFPSGQWGIAEIGPVEVGAPEIDTAASSGGATISGVWVPPRSVISRPFKGPACYLFPVEIPALPIHPGEHGQCALTTNVMVRGWVHGHFHYEIPNKKVWWDNGREGEIDCGVDHEEPAWDFFPKECHFSGENQQVTHIVAKNDWRAEGYLPLNGDVAICVANHLDLYPSGNVSRNWPDYHHGAITSVGVGNPCPWSS